MCTHVSHALVLDSLDSTSDAHMVEGAVVQEEVDWGGVAACKGEDEGKGEEKDEEEDEGKGKGEDEGTDEG